jgi:hypothetical protein
MQQPTVTEIDPGRAVENVKAYLSRTGNGESYELFIDEPWVREGYERIDLFAEFSRRAGESIDMRPTVFATDGRQLIVYGIPARKAPAFLNWLDDHILPLKNGSFVCPATFRPGQLPADMTAPAFRSIIAGCYVIAAKTIAADDPDALILRMRNRDLLAAGRVW